MPPPLSILLSRSPANHCSLLSVLFLWLLCCSFFLVALPPSLPPLSCLSVSSQQIETGIICSIGLIKCILSSSRSFNAYTWHCPSNSQLAALLSSPSSVLLLPCHPFFIVQPPHSVASSKWIIISCVRLLQHGTGKYTRTEERSMQ